jgi:hypothetical protein
MIRYGFRERGKRRSMWRKAGFAVLLTVCLLALSEGTAWLADPAREKPPPGLGSNHWSFEQHWWELSRRARQADQLDCFFLGNSRVEAGVDAEVAEQVINDETGLALDCTNMSAVGTTAAEVGTIGELIAAYYDPALIVYGFSANDVSIAARQDAHDALAGTPWIQYWQGQPSPSGWLGHHSEAYGQVLGLVSWYKFFSLGWQHRHPALTDPPPVEDETRFGLDAYLQPVDPGELEPSEKNIDGLDRLAALRDQGVIVILVEMPVYEGAWEPVFGGYETYTERFLTAIDAYAEENDVLFIHSTPFTQVDEDDWNDWEHLGKSGRQIFSTWLGHQIADRIADGEIELTLQQHAAD